jgi:hypothetical protein
MKRNAILFLSVFWLCLNLLRYNLFGYINTFTNFVRFDIVSWIIVVTILGLLTDNKTLKSIFLFTFIISLSALHNAFKLEDVEPTTNELSYSQQNFTELMFFAIALVTVSMYNWKAIKKTVAHVWRILSHLSMVLKERLMRKR